MPTTMHYKTLCIRCDTLIAQCRCPSPAKITRYETCNACAQGDEKEGSDTVSLFNLGDFILASGMRSLLKIDCDALTDDDIRACAHLLAARVPPFGQVEGVPNGGLRLAAAMEQYKSKYTTDLLIVDDVYTTGLSISRHKNGRRARGAVIFSRQQPESWVTPLFQMR